MAYSLLWVTVSGPIPVRMPRRHRCSIGLQEDMEEVVEEYG
jgi:hypothetical protein